MWKEDKERPPMGRTEGMGENEPYTVYTHKSYAVRDSAGLNRALRRTGASAPPLHFGLAPGSSHQGSSLL